PCDRAACARLVLLDHADGDSSRRHASDAADEGVAPCLRATSGPVLLLLQIRHGASRTNLPSPTREEISGRSNRWARRMMAHFSCTASDREVNRSSTVVHASKGSRVKAVGADRPAFFAYLTGNPNSTCHNLSCCHRERSEEPSATEIA